MQTDRAILIILDGWGLSPDPKVSAIEQAKTPFVDHLYQTYPHSRLVTYGEEVGLPEGQMGNSEVGHLNIGAGRIVYQELARINKAIRERTLQENEVLLEALQHAKKTGVKVHLMGLVSDGGVHSHINHLKALCDITESQGLEKVFIHAFLDGRDTDPQGGIPYLRSVQEHIEGTSVNIASVVGRYYAMDRDKRWERIKLAYDLMVNGVGEASTDLLGRLQQSYEEGVTDEFIKPILAVDKAGQALATIDEGDVVLCFNFRTDRPREISEVLTQKDFPEFGMKKQDLYYVTMTRYDESYQNVKVLFTKDDISNTLGEFLSSEGKTQVRIAETEKYPHVTFFFSGGREAEFPGEKRIMVPSPKVDTYDQQPEMSAGELTHKIIEDIQANHPNFICLNFANTDMVGHTGDFAAAVKAAEVVDSCLQDLLTVVQQEGYQALVIADHGNSDKMVNANGTPNTAHTTNPVPCIFVGKEPAKYQIKDGRLADVAPTLLAMLGLTPPVDMTGNNLIYEQ